MRGTDWDTSYFIRTSGFATPFNWSSQSVVSCGVCVRVFSGFVITTWSSPLTRSVGRASSAAGLDDDDVCSRETTSRKAILRCRGESVAVEMGERYSIRPADTHGSNVHKATRA